MGGAAKGAAAKGGSATVAAMAAAAMAPAMAMAPARATAAAMATAPARATVRATATGQLDEARNRRNQCRTGNPQFLTMGHRRRRHHRLHMMIGRYKCWSRGCQAPLDTAQPAARPAQCKPESSRRTQQFGTPRAVRGNHRRRRYRNNRTRGSLHNPEILAPGSPRAPVRAKAQETAQETGRPAAPPRASSSQLDTWPTAGYEQLRAP